MSLPRDTGGKRPRALRDGEGSPCRRERRGTDRAIHVHLLEQHPFGDHPIEVGVAMSIWPKQPRSSTTMKMMIYGCGAGSAADTVAASTSDRRMNNASAVFMIKSLSQGIPTSMRCRRTDWISVPGAAVNLSECVPEGMAIVPMFKAANSLSGTSHRGKRSRRGITGGS